MEKTPPEHLCEALSEESHDPSYLLVLTYGLDYEPRIRPAQVDAMPKRYCFRNAYRLALARQDLSYVEGFALARGWRRFPNPHAWCVDGQGRVIDPTESWADSTQALPGALRGLAIPLQIAREHVETPEPGHGVLKAFRERISELTRALDLPNV
jgi:hypothetical protein